MFWGFFWFFLLLLLFCWSFFWEGQSSRQYFQTNTSEFNTAFLFTCNLKIYTHTYLSLDNLGKGGFDYSPRHHTEFYDDDQDSGVSYSLWIISKTCIKDNSEPHFFESALVFIQDHCPASSQDRVNFYSSQEEACLGP